MGLFFFSLEDFLLVWRLQMYFGRWRGFCSDEKLMWVACKGSWVCSVFFVISNFSRHFQFKISFKNFAKKILFPKKLIKFLLVSFSWQNLNPKQQKKTFKKYYVHNSEKNEHKTFFSCPETKDWKSTLKSLTVLALGWTFMI